MQNYKVAKNMFKKYMYFISEYVFHFLVIKGDRYPQALEDS